MGNLIIAMYLCIYIVFLMCNYGIIIAVIILAFYLCLCVMCTITLPSSAELKCGLFSEWFEPFVKDWIDDITHTVKQEISVIFEECEFEHSVQQVTHCSV